MTAPTAAPPSLLAYYLTATTALAPKQIPIAARHFDAAARMLNSAGICDPSAWRDAVDDAVAAAAAVTL